MGRIQELEELIKKHKILYYQGKPEISDHAFDQLEDELKKLDPENSVLHMVGSSEGQLDKIKHDSKMLSLEKTYDASDLEKWIEGHEVVSTLKVDGVSCSLLYEHGQLVLSKTRGDGVFGENITAKVRWMDSISKTLSEKGKVEIRGELYCTEEDFLKLSEEMEKRHLERPSSQRNIVAGLVSRKENIELCRYLRFMAFDYISEKELKFESQKFEFLKKEKFIIPEFTLHKDSKKVKELIEEAKIFMSEGPYQIDGLVFTYNDLSLHRELGETAHHPRYKLAFKFKGESKETTIQDILWQVSRNGILTPVALVEDVELSGATISRVTLHNYGLVKSYNLKRGDRIEIIRSGEVIPKFLSVVKSSDQEFSIPSKCPECFSPVVIKDIRLYCESENCPGKIRENLLNFIEKIGIKELSSKRLEDLLRRKLVKEIPDLYKLSIEDFLSLDKTKETMAQKLFEEIQKTKKVDIITFLSALGISGGAYNKCEKIVHAQFNTLEKIKKLSYDDLLSVESFAEKSATDFLNSLKEKYKLIDKLIAVGFIIEEKTFLKSAFTGKKICITGELSRKRQEIEALIRERGAIVVSSVSKNTDYLLTNETDSSSSKFKKAKELAIAIISEEEFFKQS